MTHSFVGSIAANYSLVEQALRKDLGAGEVVMEGHLRKKALLLSGPKFGVDNDTFACQWHPLDPPAL